jgi:hypothetical protein
MHEPYSDKPDSKGILICGEEELNKVVRQVSSNSFRLDVHDVLLSLSEHRERSKPIERAETDLSPFLVALRRAVG